METITLYTYHSTIQVYHGYYTAAKRRNHRTGKTGGGNCREIIGGNDRRRAWRSSAREIIGEALHKIGGEIIRSGNGNKSKRGKSAGDHAGHTHTHTHTHIHPYPHRTHARSAGAMPGTSCRVRSSRRSSAASCRESVPAPEARQLSPENRKQVDNLQIVTHTALSSIGN